MRWVCIPPHSEKRGTQSGEQDWVVEGDSHAGFPQETLTWVFCLLSQSAVCSLQEKLQTSKSRKK